MRERGPAFRVGWCHSRAARHPERPAEGLERVRGGCGEGPGRARGGSREGPEKVRRGSGEALGGSGVCLENVANLSESAHFVVVWPLGNIAEHVRRKYVLLCKYVKAHGFCSGLGHRDRFQGGGDFIHRMLVLLGVAVCGVSWG